MRSICPAKVANGDHGDVGDLENPGDRIKPMDDERQLTRLCQIPTKTLDWVWPGYLAVGAITDVSGDPGEGKSRIAYDIVSRVTNARRGKPSAELLQEKYAALDAACQAEAETPAVG
jgi:hypothetical protein